MRKATQVATVVVVFVAGILLSPTSPEADAQAAFAPVVVGIAAHGGSQGLPSTLYRVWNDGVVEKNFSTTTACGFDVWCGWTVVPN